MTDAYEAAGVDYGVLDGAKRLAMELAATTIENPASVGAAVSPASLGEPATLLTVGGVTLAVVLECLGTKSVVAREVEEALGLDRWEAVGVDAVAAIVNDLCCVGAVPLTLNAYFATGSADWYSGGRHRSLVAGWKRACDQVGAAWVGGESPTLSGVVDPYQIDLAGSALGRIPAGAQAWEAGRLEVGDEIVLLASSGLHANGASLARALARSAACPDGWATQLPSGRSFGEAVLDPTVLYSGLVEAVAAQPVHYASHISGHGLRKLMRADRDLTYEIDALLPVPEVLVFMAEAAGLGPAEAYGTLNMGVGFALFVGAGAGSATVEAATAAGYGAIVGGSVAAGRRQVKFPGLGVVYASEELEIR